MNTSPTAERAAALQTVEVEVEGMDCAECAATVTSAVRGVPGVTSANVFLGSGKAVVELNPDEADEETVRLAVERAGYRSPRRFAAPTGGNGEAAAAGGTAPGRSLARRPLFLMALVFALVLLVVVAGELMGLIEAATNSVPLWLGAPLVLVLGYPVFRKVVLAAINGRIISHTLMASGALAALAIGEWVTAALVVLFMRVGDFAESSTSEQARGSLRDLAALAPQTACLIDGSEERMVPVSRVAIGDSVVVRPGEAIPVDGVVLRGQATVDQSTITGESMPQELGPGSRVYAATIAQLGSLRIRAVSAGSDTTFAKVVREVELAEANRADVQRLADRFSAWYLPLVAAIALATYLLNGNLLAAVAVTVVACSCAFALATPVAVLASIGAAARRGLLIKGGKYLEGLARVDTLLIDKTGTVTTGRPRVREIVAGKGWSNEEILSLAASVEHDSEHPLARAVLTAAEEQGITHEIPEMFESLPGSGARARVAGRTVAVGSRRLLPVGNLDEGMASAVAEHEERGDTLLFVLVDGELAGFLTAADTLRPEAPAVVQTLRSLGIETVELITGDSERVAARIANELGVDYHSEMLPGDKLAVVRQHQAAGRTVAMIGDGVNDAPALVQADVGIAMGAMGSDVAIQSAHVALMDDDWSRLPELFSIARRTMGVVRLNIGFTAVYNLIGITLAALGLLPPVYAAALQSIPDLGIMGNSARLLRYRGDGATSRTPAASA